MSMEAREEILGRIRSALKVDPANPADSYAQIAREYRSDENLSVEACLEHFLDRLVDYDTEIIHASSEGEIAAAVSQAMQRAGEHSLVVDKDFPQVWLPNQLEILHDDGLSTAEIEGVDAVLTTCEIAIASTGTIFLVHNGAQGR